MKNYVSLKVTTIQNGVGLGVCIEKKSAALNMLINSAGVYSEQYSILSITKFYFFVLFPNVRVSFCVK